MDLTIAVESLTSADCLSVSLRRRQLLKVEKGRLSYPQPDSMRVDATLYVDLLPLVTDRTSQPCGREICESAGHLIETTGIMPLSAAL